MMRSRFCFSYCSASSSFSFSSSKKFCGTAGPARSASSPVGTGFEPRLELEDEDDDEARRFFFLFLRRSFFSRFRSFFRALSASASASPRTRSSSMFRSFSSYTCARRVVRESFARWM